MTCQSLIQKYDYSAVFEKDNKVSRRYHQNNPERKCTANKSTTKTRRRRRTIFSQTFSPTIRTKQEDFLEQDTLISKEHFWKYTRSTELAKLYTQSLEEEPKYIPKIFREENASTLSQQQQTIYDNLSEHKLKAEIEVLQIRSSENQQKLEKIEHEINEFFDTNSSSEEMINELKSKWKENREIDENQIIKTWNNKIPAKKASFSKDKAIKSNNNSQPGTTTSAPISAANNAKSADSTDSQQQQPPSTRLRPHPRQSSSTSPPYSNSSNNRRYPSQQSSKNFLSQHRQAPPLLQTQQPPHLFPLNSSTFPLSPCKTVCITTNKRTKIYSHDYA